MNSLSEEFHAMLQGIRLDREAELVDIPGILLGTCDDGYPMYWALSSKSKHKIVVSDSSRGRSKLMANMFDHVGSGVTVRFVTSSEVLLNAAILAEERSYGRRLGNYEVLFVENGRGLLNASPNVVSNADWLIENGPQQGVLLVLGFDTDVAIDYQKHPWFSKSVTIYGKMTASDFQRLAGIKEPVRMDQLNPLNEFILKSEGGFMVFRV